MFWHVKKKGPLVGINAKPGLWPASPTFAQQFIIEARRQGRAVCNWRKCKPDVVLLVGKTRYLDLVEHYRKRGVKFVQRLDGVKVYDQANPARNNKNISTYHKMDAVIFQTKFCKDIWTKLFSMEKPLYIVFNGADERIFSREGSKTDFGFKRFLVTAARWRDFKNLDQMYEIFCRLGIDDLGFVVIGSGAKLPADPRVIITDKLSHKEMAGVFRAAGLFLYLPWFEWCPKVVVQALVAGLPVVCSYNGGTRELVQDCGAIVRNVNNNELEYLHPNPVNVDEAVSAVKAVLAKKERIRPRPDLYLSKMVDEYFSVFEKVLDNAG